MIKKFCVIHICFAVFVVAGMIGGCEKKKKTFSRKMTVQSAQKPPLRSL